MNKLLPADLHLCERRLDSVLSARAFLSETENSEDRQASPEAPSTPEIEVKSIEAEPVEEIEKEEVDDDVKDAWDADEDVKEEWDASDDEKEPGNCFPDRK